MKRSLCRLLLLCLVFCSCVKNEVTLNFELPKDVNSLFRIVYYASDKKRGMIQQTAVEISGGTGEIKLPTRYPAIVYIFPPAQRQPGLMLYAERGDKITISGASQDMLDWTVGGNALNEAWSDWRKKNKEALASRDEARINKAVESYVKENPKAELSLVLLMLEYSRKSDPEGFAGLYSKIDQKVVDNSELVNALSAGDLMDGIPSKGTVPSSLILKGEDGYADTVFFKGGKKTFLVFRGGKNLESHTQETEVFKSLRKDYPDTTAYVIADIYADSDSLNWRRSFEGDSLKSVRRLWLPLGVMSTEARDMGIETLPYYLVIDGKGKTLYRGDDVEKAASAFRKGNNPK